MFGIPLEGPAIFSVIMKGFTLMHHMDHQQSKKNTTQSHTTRLENMLQVK